MCGDIVLNSESRYSKYHNMPSLNRSNIYAKLPSAKLKEVFQIVLQNKKFRIERIVSCGQVTEPGKWLKELHDEWVIVLKGEGKLRFEKGNRLVHVREGDYILIPAHTSHRVAWTHPRKKTVWLAVHCR